MLKDPNQNKKKSGGGGGGGGVGGDRGSFSDCFTYNVKKNGVFFFLGEGGGDV